MNWTAGKLSGALGLSCVLAALVAGCLPFPHGGYYRPSTEGGEMVRRSCGGQVGPEEIVKVTLDGAELRFRFQDRDGSLYGHVALSVAAGSTFQFTGDRFVLQADGNSVEAVHGGLVRYDSQTRQTVREPLQSRLVGRLARSIDLNAASFAPSRFQLRVPPFEVNGQPRTLAPVSVEYRSLDIGIYPFNC